MTTMRAGLAIVATLGLVACAPAVPDSAAGVGFQDYNSYMREQAASAPRAQAPYGATMALPAAPAPQGGFSPDLAAAAIDRATGVAPQPAQPAFSTLPGAAPVAPLNPMVPQTWQVIGAQPVAPAPMPTAQAGALDPNRPRGNEPTTIQTQSGEMAAVASGGISDEQDFNAVSSRETIESDKERIERNKAQYTVIQPTAVPERTQDTGPNIVQYALSTTHNPGTPMYKRSSLRFTDPLAVCARYTSSDLAQQAFLEAGGPERDRKGLDPDGDGFACSWDPRPFRLQ